MSKHSKLEDLEREVAFLRAEMAREIAERVVAILQARRIIDAEFDPGLSPAGIRAATVAAVRGARFIDGKPQDYIDAHFEILAEESQKDPVHLALVSGLNRH